jgi:hypothetical protein
MKIFIISVIIVSTLWSLYAFPDYLIFPQLNTNLLSSFWDILIGVYKYGFPSVLWVVTIVYIYDFFMAIINKSSPYMKTVVSKCQDRIANINCPHVLYSCNIYNHIIKVIKFNY